MKLLPLVSVGLFFSQSTSASSIQKRDTVSDVLNDIKNAATCTACQSLLGVLQAVAHLGNDAFVGVITAVCQSLGVSRLEEELTGFEMSDTETGRGRGCLRWCHWT